MARKQIPVVEVKRLRTTGDAAHEGGCHVGNRYYTGRASERVEMRADDVEILVANRYVKRVAEAEA